MQSSADSQSHTPSLDEVAAAQAERKIFAFDRSQPANTLARLQRIYAAKLTQYEAFHCFFDECQPDLVLRSASKELALRLPAACEQVNEIYAGLRDALSDELRELERQIVAAHQDVARDHDEAQRYGHTAEGAPDYVPAIISLCQPTAPLTATLPTANSAPNHALAA